MYLFIYDGPPNIIYAYNKYFNLEYIKGVVSDLKMQNSDDLNNLKRVNKYVQIGLKEDQFFTFHIEDDNEAVMFMMDQDNIISSDGKDVNTRLMMVLKNPDWSILDFEKHRANISESNRQLSYSRIAASSKNYKKTISDFKNELANFDIAMKSDLTSQFEVFEQLFKQKLIEYDQERARLLQPIQAERNQLKQQFETFVVRKA
jgi:hypothetical protein